MVRLLPLPPAAPVDHDPVPLFRRYFVNTLFDSNFVILGILAAEGLDPRADAALALGTMFAACLAIAVSTGVSVFEAEHLEEHLGRRKLERAMLRDLGGTDAHDEARKGRYRIALVNASAPLVVVGVASVPILFSISGRILDFRVAAILAGVLCMTMIFGAGFVLGKVAGMNPWSKAIRMSIVALVTFAALLALESLF